MKQIDVRELESRRETLEAQIHEIERRGMHMTPEEHRRWEAEFHRNWDEAHKIAEHNDAR